MDKSYIDKQIEIIKRMEESQARRARGLGGVFDRLNQNMISPEQYKTPTGFEVLWSYASGAKVTHPNQYFTCEAPEELALALLESQLTAMVDKANHSHRSTVERVHALLDKIEELGL